MIAQDPLFNNQIRRLAAMSIANGLPAIYADRQFAVAGGLMSYGANQIDTYRQAGHYAARILKGEKPADLPVMQPAKFDLAINLKTAKALGLSTKLAGLADEVIE
jgi:putative ABC transport system substrate-binding protein